MLIVDDDPVFTTLAGSCLGAAGFSITQAYDGAAALELLETNRFDVAIIDLAMPKVDGFRLIGLIRGMRPLERLAIMVISSRQDPEAFKEALALGANAFHTKPVNWTLLPTHIRYVMQAVQACQHAN